MLGQDQIEFYRENGYLIVAEVFSPDEIAALKAATAELTEASREVPASNPLFDLAPDHSALNPKVRRIKHPQDNHPAYDRAMRSPRLLDILEGLIGPAIRFDHGKLNIKPVGGGAAVEWHQDWAFYPHSNDDILAVGILLEDCGPENGPLLVIPGSHKGPVYDHHHDGMFVGAIDPAAAAGDLDKAVALTGPAGACTFHHVRMLHGSTVNRGNRERPLLLFSYAAVDAWPLVDAPPLDEFDRRILRGQATLAPRQEALPVRLPMPKDPADDSIFDNQASVLGRSFGAEEAEPASAANYMSALLT